MSFTISALTVEVDPLYGCWIWTGKLGNNGRPIIWRGKRPSSAHQVVYEAEVGDVPEGKVLDHLCRRVLCVRAMHLEPVTKQENERRKSFGYLMKRTHCARGHSLATALVTPEMGRLCRVCHRGMTS